MTESSAQTFNDGLPPRERIVAAIAVAVAVALSTLDTAITNTALPTIARDIGTDDASSIWVVNAYQVATVATIIPIASLGEIIGHRRVFLTGLILFVVTSLFCGLAWSLPSLVVARALQGIGSAGIMGVNVAMMRFIFPLKLMGRGMGLNALVVGIAFTIGPTVASAILSVTTWHWLFLINVPLGLIAIALSLKTLPQTHTTARKFDLPAAILSGAFFTLLIYALGDAAHGQSPMIVIAEFAASAACLFLLTRRQAGNPAPMLPLDLFRNPVFALSSATSICAFATQGLAFVSLPFLLQNTLHHSQVETGFLMTPWPLVVAIMAPIAGRLSDRYPVAFLGGGGLLMLALGMASLTFLPPNPNAFDLTWRLLLCGAGFGFFQSPNLRAIMSSAPPHRSGGASGIVATSRLLGQSSGAALVALTITFWHEHGPIVALGLGAIFSAAGSLFSFLRLVPDTTAGESAQTNDA